MHLDWPPITARLHVMTGEAWPFPGHPSRWDAARLGKVVLGVFALLVLIAAGLVAYRLASNAEQARERRERQAAGIELADYVGISEEEAVEDLLTKLQAGIDDIEANPEDFVSSTARDDASAAAKDLGLKECG